MVGIVGEELGGWGLLGGIVVVGIVGEELGGWGLLVRSWGGGDCW